MAMTAFSAKKVGPKTLVKKTTTKKKKSPLRAAVKRSGNNSAY